jgi:hypothetical protein
MLIQSTIVEFNSRSQFRFQNLSHNCIDKLSMQLQALFPLTSFNDILAFKLYIFHGSVPLRSPRFRFAPFRRFSNIAHLSPTCQPHLN